MESQNIIVDMNPKVNDIEFIENQLYSYNMAKTGLPFGGFISCVIKDNNNLIIAGVHGYSWGDCCHINYMWVDETQRGCGYGSKLLKIIEEEAKKRGCKMMVAETFSFQALPFYQKANYEVTGKMDGFPKDPHQNYFIKKMLS